MDTESPTDKNDAPQPRGKFAEQADRPNVGFFAELLAYLHHNRKWWLLPIIAVLLLLGVLVAAGGTGLAPFIYALW